MNSEPRWSPSGDWLAFRGRDDRVWVMEGHGGGAFRLSGGTSVTTFGWAPNGDGWPLSPVAP
jgi:Tol biopolymer transport system component